MWEVEGCSSQCGVGIKVPHLGADAVANQVHRALKLASSLGRRLASAPFIKPSGNVGSLDSFSKLSKSLDWLLPTFWSASSH